MPSLPEPVLLSPAHAAAQLDVSPRTLRRLAAEGQLEVVRLSSQLPRYTLESITRLINNARTEARANPMEEPDAVV